MNGRSSKAKGYAGERAVVEYLRANGFPYAERRRAGAAADTGDVIAIPGLTIEVKNQQRMALADWTDQMLSEMQNTTPAAWQGVVVHKRKGKTSPGDWYATTTFDLWLRMLKEGYVR
jgi:hypothetical protein